MFILTCKLGNEIINCYDGTYSKEQLKEWSDKKLLLCPVCGKPYEYCHGLVSAPYFRHADKIDCEPFCSEPETEEHINGKINLYKWIKSQPRVSNVILEAWIPETKQRPDIYFVFNGRQCVIEYQCSPIASEYYERHKLYSSIGISDIWICGTLNYFQKYHTGNGYKKMNTLEKESLKYYDPFMNILFHVNEDGYGIPINMLHFYNDDFSNHNKRRDNYYRTKSERNNEFRRIKYKHQLGWKMVNYSVAKCLDLNQLSLDSEVFKC